MNEQIAVLTVSYNHEQYIGQCIESVLEQKCDIPVVHYIWDDHSTDSTLQVVKTYQTQYPDRIVSYSQPTNKGAAQNYWDVLEAILQNPKNQYIALLDGDDYYCNPLGLQHKYEYMQQCEGCGLVHSNCYSHNGGGYSLLFRKAEEVAQGNILELMVNIPQFHALTVFMKADYLRDLPINELRQLHLLTVDHLIEVWVCSKAKVGFIEDVTGVWRRHEQTISTPRTLEGSLRWIEHECAQGRWLNQHFPVFRKAAPKSGFLWVNDAI